MVVLTPFYMGYIWNQLHRRNENLKETVASFDDQRDS